MKTQTVRSIIIVGALLLLVAWIWGAEPKANIIPEKPMVWTKQERVCAEMIETGSVYNGLSRRERHRYCRVYIKNNPQAFGND